MSIVVALIILSFLVIIHELGHFFAAKKVGVRVEEFGWGLPPRLLWKKFGETIYSINLLPIGGFVKLTGEDSGDDTSERENEDVAGSKDTVLKYDPYTDPKSFMSKTVWERAFILVSGVVMNALFAFVAFYLYFFITGFKTPYVPTMFNQRFLFGTQNLVETIVMGVESESPAEKAGVLPGEAIIAVNDIPVNSYASVRSIVAQNVGKDITLTLKNLASVKKEVPLRTVTLRPYINAENTPVIGVYFGQALSVSYDTFVERLFAGPLHAVNVLHYSFSTLGKLVSVSVETRNVAPVSQSVSGPVGIFKLISGIVNYAGDDAGLMLLDFSGLISISLAFMNILPFPALDGGRVVFLVIEGIRGKRVDPKVETFVHKLGMLALLAFIVLLTIKDLFL